jgi:hypothetical protein
VTLDIRPLSSCPHQLIHTILSLQSRAWSDRQVANRCNEIRYMTPRGARGLPQSVFSMRNKYGARVERLGGKW